MSALEVLTDAVDRAAALERQHLHEMDGMRSEVARLERHVESLQSALWEQTRLTEELGSVPAREVADVA